MSKRRRRHTNTTGYRQIQRGKPAEQVARMARRALLRQMVRDAEAAGLYDQPEVRLPDGEER